jgi:hypothetical protein
MIIQLSKSVSMGFRPRVVAAGAAWMKAEQPDKLSEGL